jgi:hypothetical protein
MKVLQYLLIIVSCVVVFFTACEEKELGPIDNDGIPPGPVTNASAQSIPGGALITYTIPGDEDLSYVKAVYTLKNGKKREVTVSKYHSKIKVDGFGDTFQHTIELYAVDRGENVSQPLEVTITPLTPPVHKIGESIQIISDFGGASFLWNNPDTVAVAVVIMAPDQFGRLLPKTTVYTKTENGKHTLRGYESKETRFAAYIRDQWDNYSDTLQIELVPLYEIELDKSKFRRLTLAGDTNVDQFSGSIEKTWNGDYLTTVASAANYCHSKQPADTWPAHWSMNLGVKAQLSRFIWWGRQEAAQIYQRGNPKILEIWGWLGEGVPPSVTYPVPLTADVEPSDPYWAGWKRLVRAEAGAKPSGRPIGTNTAEDNARWLLGEGADFDTNNTPPVQYLRIRIVETWGSNNWCHISEISFFGQPLE